LFSVDPLPVFQVEARANVQDVIPKSVRCEPASPGAAETIADAYVSLDNHLVEATVEAPEDELAAELMEHRAEAGSPVQPELGG
jgi:hypothetical protein